MWRGTRLHLRKAGGHLVCGKANIVATPSMYVNDLPTHDMLLAAGPSDFNPTGQLQL